MDISPPQQNVISFDSISNQNINNNNNVDFLGNSSIYTNVNQNN